MGSQFEQKNKMLTRLKRRCQSLQDISVLGCGVSIISGGILIFLSMSAVGRGYPRVNVEHTVLDFLAFFGLVAGLCVFVVCRMWYKVAVLHYERIKKQAITSPESENSVVEELLNSVTNDNLRETVSILGDIGNTRGASLCIDALRNLDMETRLEALAALTKIPSDIGRDPVFDALNDSENFVRGKASVVIDKWDWKPKNDIEHVSYLLAKGEWEQVLKFGRLAVEPLIKMLKDKDKMTRLNAAIFIGKIKDQRVVEPLIEALKDIEEKVKKQALTSLKTVTGKSFFLDRGQKQWREWWGKNREAIIRDWEKP
ncbi:MAG: HEAT repeat domain-containing protein [Desulfosalsimonadaceae bacterium]